MRQPRSTGDIRLICENKVIYPMRKRNFSTIAYFNHLADANQPKYRFKGLTEINFENWKMELLPELKNLLGPMPQPIPLNPEIIYEVAENGLIERRVIFDTEEFMSVAAILLIPESAKTKPSPAILCNHGHCQFGKDSVMGTRNSNQPERESEIVSFNMDFGWQMAQRGYVTMAIDWRGFGERNDGENPYSGRDRCNVHFIRGSLMGMNLMTLDVFDGMRAIDYLCSLDCVDSRRIGAMGISLGGTLTMFLGLLDNRIKASDIICYSCRFKDFAVTEGNFCGSQFVPGLFSLCDVLDLQGLIAPKPLLAEIGVHDTCFPVEEALSCSKEVKRIYESAGVSENYEVDLFDGGHKFSGRQAFAFFDRHLKQ
jgi:dienelactone hydrolase